MKLIYKIRTLTLVAASCLVSAGAFSQVTKTDYFMKSSYLRTSLNPAMRPDQGYIIVPMLPNVGVGLKTNTLNLDHLTYPIADGKRATFMHKDVSSDKFLSRMKENNYLRADVTYKLGGVGFYSGEGFWTVDMGVRAYAEARLPKTLFELLKDGFAQNKQTKYDIRNMGISAEAFVETGVGYSRPFMDNALVVGAKAKVLIGGGNFDLNAKSFSIEAGPEKWEAMSQITLSGSAWGLEAQYKKDEKGYSKFDKFEFNNGAVAGYGLGFDLGAEYDLGKTIDVLKGLKVSGALTDIGFISWNAKSSVELASSQARVTINPNDYTIHNDGSSSLKDVFDDVVEDLGKAVDLQGEATVGKGRTTSLRSTLNLGAEYEILPEKFSAGVLFSNNFGKYYNASEVAISANFTPTKWFAVSGGYSFVHSAFDTFGLAFHLAPSKGVRLFVASDYFIYHHNSDALPTTSKGINVQTGISIPIGGRR